MPPTNCSLVTNHRQRIEPIFYQAIQLGTSAQLDLFARTVNHKPKRDVISNNVRVLQFGNNLSFQTKLSSIATALSVCANAQSVWLSPVLDVLLGQKMNLEILSFLGAIRPKRLRTYGGNHNHILSSLTRTYPGCLDNLTHLLLDNIDHAQNQLRNFPSLTHVIFSSTRTERAPLDTALRDFLELETLVACGIIVTREFDRVSLRMRWDKSGLRDARLVTLPPSDSREADWVAAYFGKADLFSIASELVSERRVAERASSI